MTYVLGLPSDSGKAAERGTMVHKVMEVLANLRLFQQENPKRKFLETTDDVLKKVRVKTDRLMEKDFVEELLDLSYTGYRKDSPNKWAPADRKEISRLTWLGLDHNNGQFDPRLRQILNPEPHFDIEIKEDWAKYEYEVDGKPLVGNLAIKGTIDLVTTIDDDTIEVLDWKTGQRKNWATGEKKTYAKLCEDPQLLLYYYAISNLYPEYKNVIMSIFYVKDGGPFSMCWDDSDKVKFLGMLKNRFLQIKRNNKPQPISYDRSNFKCTRLCHYCKNKWQGSNKSMCQYVGDYIDGHGIDKASQDLKHKDFTIGHYEAPG
jgi:hypothetical protein|tara:strand:+ start:319 stop:1272 length:954 start_codon:yes stop_codon:yes gene_type:complete